MAAESRFTRWLHQAGIESPKCGFGNFLEGGRGVIAIRRISKDEIVVNVPDEAVLMPENCIAAEALEDEGFCNSSGDPQMNVLGLIIAVMIEKKLKRKSRWKGYLDFLPSKLPGMPMFWPTADLQLLHGTSALGKIHSRTVLQGIFVEPPCQVEALFSELVMPFLGRHPGLGLAPDAPDTLSLYKWATAAVSAYSFTVGDDRFQAMVPMWDALNHITGTANVRLDHCANLGALQMIATRDIARGEQVVNSFGDLSNGELLRRYGFVEPRSNPHDCAELPFESLHERCTAWRAQHALDSSEEGKACMAGRSHPEQTGINTRKLLRDSGLQTDSIREGLKELQALKGRCNAAAEDSFPAASSTACAPPLKRKNREGDLHEADRVAFLASQGLIPGDGWFKFRDEPPAELLEVARLLLLSESDFRAFARRLARWRPPLLRPLRVVAPSDVPLGFREVLTSWVQDHISRLEETEAAAAAAVGCTGSDVDEGDGKCNGTHATSNAQMAAIVRAGELRGLSACLEWLVLHAVDVTAGVHMCSPVWQHLRHPVN